MIEQTTSSTLFPARVSLREPIVIAGASVPSCEILRGRSAILAAQPLLARIAENSGQAGEADSLEFFLSLPHLSRKAPALLLLNGPTGPDAAVLVFEYRSPFGGARVFATADGTGRRDVLAPPSRRARTAAIAARALLTRGAHIVHIAFSETHHSEDECRNRPIHHCGLPSGGFAEQAIAAEFRTSTSSTQSAEWSLRERDIPAYLPLLCTFDDTLARIGQRTRSNLRYYRRRAEIALGAAFVPASAISLQEFLIFNRGCTYAVSDQDASRRYEDLTHLRNGFLMGVRSGQGQWLSLVGGRYHGRYAEIDWQMNRDDLPSSSLGLVMRSYLIEHEIARGSTRLYIEGGTPQPIGRSFLKQRVGELTVKRNSAYVGLLERFAPLVFPAKNYVGQTLIDPDLHWKRC